MKKSIAFIMAILTTFTALSFGACNGADVSDSSTGNEQVEIPEKQPESNITATIIRPDNTYNFCSEIAFMGSDLTRTATSEYEEVSAELVATVEPIDANQNVDWSVSFKNPTSAWAQGKTVTDYVTITPKSAGSTTATVTCKAPFGEQILITCRSQDNAEISADCTVDFVQTIQNASLTFGNDLPINLGGETGIEWEMNPNGIGKGGAANVNVETYDTYTIATDDYSWEIDLISPDYYYNGIDDEMWGTDSSKIGLRDNYGKFLLNGSEEYNISFARKEALNHLIFDFEMAANVSIGTSVSDTGYTSATLTAVMDENALFFLTAYTDGQYIIDWSQLKGIITEASMYTLRLTLKNSTETVEFLSLLKWQSFTNNPQVQSVSFAKTALRF